MLELEAVILMVKKVMSQFRDQTELVRPDSSSVVQCIVYCEGRRDSLTLTMLQTWGLWQIAVYNNIPLYTYKQHTKQDG